MKKLENLRPKELKKKNLNTIIGALMAPDFTVYQTGCTDTGSPNIADCSDSHSDKDK
ncbi:hypothetical protein QGN23_01240 [Chryseobacterium gotjawalense]|uniref:Bacteriocin n=1 Tax=Chryseobacterium gotjawalense TaxID=3042315 RepID=A0ABY8RDH7_9FLAO|nr:hypothetical protein [Chryseobacterium sp. wdc7]WHF51916.1 hypothetical protein QGN23_01240 [Chryseobacterium sp. wdc7]